MKNIIFTSSLLLIFITANSCASFSGGQWFPAGGHNMTLRSSNRSMGERIDRGNTNFDDDVIIELPSFW
jgi:hypothetical protein